MPLVGVVDWPTMPIRGVLLNNLIPPFPNGTCDPIFTKRIEWMVSRAWATRPHLNLVLYLLCVCPLTNVPGSLFLCAWYYDFVWRPGPHTQTR